MAGSFDRDQLLDAFDQIGGAAIRAGVRLNIAVFGGSALMLASNFRFSTEDVDIAQLDQPWPAWLTEVVSRVANQHGWSPDWLNEAVAVHLSPHAKSDRDLVAFGSFPRADEKIGLAVFVPSARYLLALKLKALRIADFDRGSRDVSDVANLLATLSIADVEQAIAVLAEFFPVSAADADKQRFVLRHIFSNRLSNDAPRYPQTDI